MHNISFFIPAYNCGKTVGEAIDSIISGNFTDGDEIVIVNDCSPDNTAEIIEGYAIKYPFIKVIHHLRNKGGAAARNTAIENAKNDLVFCLDSDNVLAPDTIIPLKEYLLETQADAATVQHQHFFEGDYSKPYYTWSLPAGTVPLEMHLEGKNVPGQHGNYLFTKESWLNAGGYTEGTGALDTWTFGLKQAITGTKFVCLENTHYYHRLDSKDSYWMRDAESKIWSVSLKVTYALIPYLDRIEEDFVNYMFNAGRYSWYYTLNKKPLKLVDKGHKDEFYKELHTATRKIVYPDNTLAQRIIKKIQRTIKK